MKGWAFNLNNQKKGELLDPLGYIKNIQQEPIQSELQQQHQQRDLQEKKVYAFATSGMSQIFMAFLMIWLSGGGLNIFTIIFTFQFLMQPVKTLLSINKAFKQFEGKKVSLFKYKLIYAGIQLLILSIAMYKFHSIGLLPFAPSDWIDLVPKFQQTEIVFNLS